MPWKSQQALRACGEMLGEEAAAILLGEDAGEAPFGFGQRADIEDVDDHEVAGLRALDPERAARDSEPW